MKMSRYNLFFCVLILATACSVMGVVDAIIQPGYAVKSAVKLAVFLILPFVYSRYNKSFKPAAVLKPSKRGLLLAVGIGIAVYAVVIGAYFMFRNIFDFSSMTDSITASTGVNKNNFIFVAIYISFVNSFLEEFFFRGFAFLHLSQLINKRLAYVISAGVFAAYHVSMMLGWFDVGVVGICLVGLFVGGVIFNRFAEKQGNIYLSWLIHMFANFATNTIGFVEFLSI